MRGVQALSAACFPTFDSPFMRMLGAPKRLSLDERQARNLRVGGYYQVEGKLWKIVGIRKPEDWFDTRVTLLLKNWTNHGIPSLSARMGKIEWLEDQFLPGEIE